MGMPFKITLYWDEDLEQVGLLIANRHIEIFSGNDAELIFNNICEQLEEIGYLGRPIGTKMTKAYLIEKA